jgi:nucleoside transporter
MKRVDPRLCLMMFLHYSVWGVWMPILPTYLAGAPEAGGLGFSERELGWIAGVAGSIGTLLSPFIAGQLADRYFSTERYLGVTLLIGGAINFVLATRTSVTGWLVLSTIYAVLYMPTLGLTNSLAMAHLSDPKRQFSLVRVWGTIAWITVLWVFPMAWLQSDLRLTWMPPFLVGDRLPDATGRIVDALRVSGAISILYGFYAFFLPHTPPKRDAVEPIAFAKAFAQLRRRSMAVLVAASFVFAAVHKLYFVQTSKFLKSIGVAEANIGAAMSVGQFSEILVMLVFGRLLARCGFRVVLTIGAAAYVARFACFGLTGMPLEFTVASQVLHGVCFACAWVTTYVYIDRIAPPDVRHSIQAVFNMTTMGLGFITGGWLSGEIGTLFTGPDKVVNYQGIWFTAAALALIPTLLLGLAFRDETRPTPG